MDWCEREARFPNETLFKRKEGTHVEVNGQTFYLSKVFKESYRSEFECYYVFFEKQPVSNTGETVVLNFRYVLDTGLHDEMYQSRFRHNSTQDLLRECRALSSLGESGYLPRYVTLGEILKTEDGLYPGGAGYDETSFCRDEIRRIKGQIVQSYEYFRQLRWETSYDVEDIFFNKEKGQLFYLGLTDITDDINLAFEYLQHPITEPSPNLDLYWNSLPPV